MNDPAGPRAMKSKMFQKRFYFNTINFTKRSPVQPIKEEGRGNEIWQTFHPTLQATNECKSNAKPVGLRV